MIGWIKISRDISNHWIWKDDTKLKWWLDMLITVNFKDSKTLMGNQLIECKRGQSTMSLQHWATRWKVDKNKVRNFFVLLEKDGMILHENLSKTTRITICNYDTYQSKENDTKTIPKRNQNADETQLYPIEEGKEGLEENKQEKIFNPSDYLISYGASIDLIKSWFEIRKKKKRVNSEIAMQGFIREVEKSKQDINAVLKKCIEKSWVGFEADWVKSQKLETDIVDKVLWVKARIGSTVQDFVKSKYEQAVRENKLNCDNPEIIKEYYR